MIRSSTPLRTLVAAVLIALVWAATSGPSARADDPKPWHIGVTPAQRIEAQRHLDQGNSLLQKRLYAPGVASYERALASWYHPAIHFNLARGLVVLNRSDDALLHFWIALRFGVDGLGPDAAEQAIRFIPFLMELDLVHLVVVSDENGPLRLGDREIMVGPGRWEGVMLAGPIKLTAPESKRVWSQEAKAGDRVEVIWSAKRKPKVAIRAHDPGDLPDLMLATLGYVVAMPTGADISKAKPIRYRIDDIAQALVAPFDRNPEARHLCKGATGELVQLCRAYDADLIRLEARWKEASAGWADVWRKYREMTVGGLLDYLH